MQDNSKYLKIWKPFIDRMAALMLFVLLLPVMVSIAVLLKINGSSIIFKHSRPGINEQLFELYKFTSMKNGEITKIGSLLRKSSLDEIPQLVNIIKGEMSFVGPRPLLKEYLETYSNTARKRHQVKPGVTGLAQVNGRNAITLDEKVKLDIAYVQNVSFVLDLKILLKTAVRIFYFHQADYHSLELRKH